MYFVHKGPLVYQFSCNFQVLLSTFKYWHFERYLLFRATICVALSSWAKCWRRQRPLDWRNCSSSSSSSSVLNHRGHQSLEKKNGAGTLSECFHWCSFYILTWHVRFIREQKKITINLPTNVRICASLSIFQFTNATIRLFFFVSSLSCL